MERKRPPQRKRLSTQMRRRVTTKRVTQQSEYDGYTDNMISTGSTLLDLAISGGRVRGGGIPAGILVEIFGQASSGKTVLLCELAGAIQRQEGEVMFHDPEARLNKQFARMFDLDINAMIYSNPDTVPEVFKVVRKWEPKDNAVHGIFADSLAALSTNMEMEEEAGDKMGMRRAREFSEELRKTCRILARNHYLMVCSNQIRQNVGSGQFTPKYKSPGGEAIGFYSSLRLRTTIMNKMRRKVTVANREVMRFIGIEIEVDVFKSTVWKPYHVAPVTILFDYGIDDIRQNLQFIKSHTKNTIYMLGSERLDKSIEQSIRIIEDENLEMELRNNVIDLWEDIERRFKSNRKLKQR
jgi:protein RecA